MSDAPARRVPTEFDWLIYADATFAGLALLLPIPFVDGLIESYFRRRMPRDIARRRGRALPSQSIRAVNRQREKFWSGCLLWPVQAVAYLIRNIWRTMVYVLTIYDTSEKLSYYWHRAFLLDYAIGRGDLDRPARAELAAAALHQSWKRRRQVRCSTWPRRSLPRRGNSWARWRGPSSVGCGGASRPRRARRPIPSPPTGPSSATT